MTFCTLLKKEFMEVRKVTLRGFCRLFDGFIPSSPASLKTLDEDSRILFRIIPVVWLLTDRLGYPHPMLLRKQMHLSLQLWKLENILWIWFRKKATMLKRLRLGTARLVQRFCMRGNNEWEDRLSVPESNPNWRLGSGVKKAFLLFLPLHSTPWTLLAHCGCWE